MVHCVSMLSVSWKIPQANNEDLMKERKHNRFFDTFELCPWPICPQRGFIYTYNISVAQIHQQIRQFLFQVFCTYLHFLSSNKASEIGNKEMISRKADKVEISWLSRQE